MSNYNLKGDDEPVLVDNGAITITRVHHHSFIDYNIEDKYGNVQPVSHKSELRDLRDAINEVLADE